jgi:tetratricopeptide (TPR) repeat protein
MILLLVPALVQAAQPVDDAEMGRLLMQARTERNQGRFDAAVAAYDAMLAKDGWHETALFERAQTLGWSKRYAESVQAWKLFRERAPWRAKEADQNLAMVASWGRMFEPALQALDPYVKQNERWAVLDAAKYLSWAGRYRESLGLTSTWLAAHPDDADARLTQARVLSWDGRMADARRDYSAVLAADPGKVEARLGLAQVDSWGGRPREARAEFDRLAPEDRQTPEARLLDGQIALAEGRRRAGVAILRPLADQPGPGRQDARDLLRGAAEANGPLVELGGGVTTTSEKLRFEDDTLRARLPLGDGSAGLGLARHHSSLQGAAETPREFSGFLAYPLGAFRFSGEAGRMQDYGGTSAGFHRLGLTWSRPGLELSLAQGRGLVTYTPQAVEQRVGLQTLDAGVAFLGAADTLRLQGGTASVSAGNRRTTWNAGYDHRWRLAPVTLAAGLTSQGLEFNRTLPLGFWNPHHYLFDGITGSAGLERGRFNATLDGRWGRQQVEDLPWTSAWGYGLGFSWGLGDGPVTLLGGFNKSNSGLAVQSVGAPNNYQEKSFRLGLRLAGPWR